MYRTDFQKLGTSRSGRGSANAWDLSCCKLCRLGRDCRNPVVMVVCFRIRRDVVCLFFVFFTSNAHGLRHVSGSLASFTSLLVPGCVLASLILSVCCVLCRWPISLIARAVRGQFPQTRCQQKRVTMGKRVGLISSHAVTPSRVGCGRRAVVFWVVCFGCGGISFLCSLFLLGTHMAYCEYEVALPHLPVYYCSS